LITFLLLYKKPNRNNFRDFISIPRNTFYNPTASFKMGVETK